MISRRLYVFIHKPQFPPPDTRHNAPDEGYPSNTKHDGNVVHPQSTSDILCQRFGPDAGHFGKARPVIIDGTLKSWDRYLSGKCLLRVAKRARVSSRKHKERQRRRKPYVQPNDSSHVVVLNLLIFTEPVSSGLGRTRSFLMIFQVEF